MSQLEDTQLKDTKYRPGALVDDGRRRFEYWLTDA
jgi:hypothetical protein